jgi:N-acetylglucosamine-6-phosphate deacetylase
VAAGARSATHLFNAMRPLHHREPGAVGAVLDCDALSCELICDGLHVDPAALRLAWRAKGTGGVRLVTDAMQAAGMPDGTYMLGGAPVEVRSGRTRLGSGEVIAGSTLTMDVALRNAVRFLRVPVADASAMASQNPARVLGIERRKGAIAAGLDADLVVLDDSLHVCATMVEGGWVSEAPV